MLTIYGGPPSKFCDGLSRRSFLRVGALAAAGMLTLPEFLRQRASAVAAPTVRRSGKSVIMICLGGGPSHIDTYDMKPDAPAEFRGEFNPVRSNVPGMELCELLPQQAKIADKFAVVRSATWVEPDHQRIEIFTGYPKRQRRPSFGSCVSRLYGGPGEGAGKASNDSSGLPRFVSLSGDDGEIAEAEQPLWVGAQHRAFVPKEDGLSS